MVAVHSITTIRGTRHASDHFDRPGLPVAIIQTYDAETAEHGLLTIDRY